jgi:hypothetical protein
MFSPCRVICGLMLLVFGFLQPCFSQPANDDFADRYLAEGNIAFVTGTVAGASIEIGEPFSSYGFTLNSVWWTWVAPETGAATLTLEGGVTAKGIFTGSSLTNLQLTPRYNCCQTGYYEWLVEAGQSYQIAIGQRNSFTTNYTGSIQFFRTPANDQFTNRIAMPRMTELTTTTNTILATVGAGSDLFTTLETEEPPLWQSGYPSTQGRTLWWTWTAPTNGLAIFSFSPTSTPMRGGVYTGDALTNLATRRLFGRMDNINREATLLVRLGDRFEIQTDRLTGTPTGEVFFEIKMVPCPSNDDFAASSPLPPMTNTVTSSNSVWETAASGSDRHATREAGEPILAAFSPHGPTTWWNWVAPANGIARFRVQTTGPMEVGLFTGSTLSNLVKHRESAGSGSVQLQQQVHAGARYELMTERQAGVSGEFTIHIEFIEAPPNDDFANRLNLVGDELSFAGNLGFATVEQGESIPGPQTAVRQSLWWKWTAPSSGNVTMTLLSGEPFLTPPRIGVYLGNAVNALTLVTNGGGVDLPMRINFHAQAGTEYQITVALGSQNSHPVTVFLTRNTPPVVAVVPTNDFVLPQNSTLMVNVDAVDSDGFIETLAWNVSTRSGMRALQGNLAASHLTATLTDIPVGTYQFTASALDNSGFWSSTTRWLEVPPTNDSFANRIPIVGLPAIVRGTNSGSTLEIGEPIHAGLKGFGSSWWTWLAPTNGPVVLAIRGSDGNGKLAVYTGSSVDALSLLASNQAPTGFTTNIAVQFNSSAGTAYQIAIDSSSPWGSTFDVALLAPPPNDHFTNAVQLVGDAVHATGYNYSATAESGEPSHQVSPKRSVWWSWKSPFTGKVQLETSNNFRHVTAVYTGGSVSNLTKTVDSSGSASQQKLQLLAQKNQTYRIAVDGQGGDEGDISLKIRPVDVPAISDLRLQTGTLSFTVEGIPDRHHSIEGSTNLVNWDFISSVRLQTNTTRIELPNWPPASAIFLRVRLQPE